jgi:O-antigen/teichoic acid export membrane protein
LSLLGRDFSGAGHIVMALGLAWMIYYAKGPVSAVLDMTGRQFIDLANLAGVLLLSLVLGLWLIPKNGAPGAGFAIAVSVLAWSVAETIEGWAIFRFPPFRRHFLRTILLTACAFGAGFLLQGRISSAANFVIVGSLYVLLSLLVGFSHEDRELFGRGMNKLTLSLQRLVEVLVHN